jgi:hypothetical protein
MNFVHSSPTQFFFVDLRLHIEMNRLKTITTWIQLILQFKNLHNFHIIIQALNTIMPTLGKHQP